MKKMNMLRILALAVILRPFIVLNAQTLNVTTSSGTTQVSASDAGTMTYSSSAGTLNIGGTAYNVSDITKMTITSSSSSGGESSDDLSKAVTVVYNGSSATVTVASDISSYITVSQSGAHVSITQSDDVADEITYTLSGSSSDGEFYLAGSYKCTVELNGLTLTNATPVTTGAAVHIQNGKRVNIKLIEGTTSTLKDASSGSQKGCLYVKGHAEFKQKGTLNVVGNLKHAIKSGEYLTVKNSTINVTSSVGDGINCAQYFLIESGSISISGTGDDGIQCDIDESTTGETTDHEDEDGGNIYLQGGTISIEASAAASKGIKAEGFMKVTDGTYTIKTTGSGAYDSDDNDAKGCAGLKSDGDMTISGGTLTLSSSGSGGKCINTDGALNITDGTIDAQSTGSKYSYSSSATASPKCIKSDGAMTISGGSVVAYSKNHEAIESKSTINITGGYVSATAGDDAINAAGDFTISGGYVMANSTGNDGMDANGNFYVKGGIILAISTTSPEVAIDANTEANKQLYITGGNLVAIGGLENGASVSNGSAYQASSYSKSTWYALYKDSSVAFAFKVPSNSSMGTPMVVYTTGTTALKSGVTGSGTSFWDGNGYSSASGGSDVSLSSYSGGGGMGGGGDVPGGGGSGPGGNSGGGPGGSGGGPGW